MFVRKEHDSSAMFKDMRCKFLCKLHQTYTFEVHVYIKLSLNLITHRLECKFDVNLHA